MKITITGANSYLGRYITDYFLQNSNFQLNLVHSHHSNETDFIKNERIFNIKADLTDTFEQNFVRMLKESDKIFHFAWVRGKNTQEVSEKNEKILFQLLKEIEKPEKLYFISSVSGTPNTKSEYGKNKYKALKIIQENKAIAIILGLVIEDYPQKGPYKLLLKIAKLPISFRISKNEPLVFPIKKEVFANNLLQIATEEKPKNNYSIFEQPIGFNSFMQNIENKQQKKRIKLRINANILLNVANILKKIKIFPSKIPDQILTFFYKDSDFILDKEIYNYNFNQNNYAKSSK